MKSNDHSIALNKKTKKVSGTKIHSNMKIEHKVELLFLGEYYNLFTRTMSPITQRFIEHECSKIMEWAQDESSLRIVDYTDSQGYPPEVYYEWTKKYPEIKLAHEFALRRIGSRREQGAMTRKFSEGTIHRTLGYYDPIFASETYKLSKMKEEISQSSEPKIVILERFPSMSGEYGDIEVVSTSKFTPEQVAANIHRNTATQREVKINTAGKDFKDVDYESDEYE